MKKSLLHTVRQGLNALKTSLGGLEKRFVIAITISLVIILLVAPSSWLIYDVSYFIKWDNEFRERGLLYVYAYSHPTPNYKVAYPPLAVLLFIIFYEVGVSLTGSSLPLLRLITKTPLIISFTLIAYYLYKYYGWRASKWFLVSIAAYATIVSYQFDLVVALGLFLSFLSLYKKKSPMLSGAFFTMAVLTKPLPGVLMPLYMADSYRLKKNRGVVEFLLGVLIIGLPLTLPFFIYSPENFIEHVIIFHSRRIPQELSLYALPLYLSHYNWRVLPRFLTWIWIPFFFIVYAYIMNILLSRPNKLDEACGSLSYASVLLTVLALNKVGNNPYFVWILPFLAICISKVTTDLKMKLVYLLIPIVSMGLYGFSTFITAGVVRGYIFLAEDLKWYNAYDLLVDSFKDSPIMDMKAILGYLHENYYEVFYTLYKYMWLSMIVTTILYVAMLLYMAYRFIECYRFSCCEGECSAYKAYYGVLKLWARKFFRLVLLFFNKVKGFFKSFSKS